jgi:hypothetical protein
MCQILDEKFLDENTDAAKWYKLKGKACQNPNSSAAIQTMIAAQGNSRSDTPYTILPYYGRMPNKRKLAKKFNTD